MSQNTQGTQHWPHFSEGTIAVDYDATNEQLIQLQRNNPNALSPGSQRQVFLTGPDGLSEEHDMAPGHNDTLNRDLIDLNLQDQFPFPFNGNEPLQACDSQDVWSFFNLSNEEAGGRTSVGTSATRQLSSQAWTGTTNPQGSFPFPFRGNERSQAGNAPSSSLNPSNAACAPAPSTITGPSAELPVPSAAGTVVIELPGAEDDLKAVGTPKMRQASGKRRKKEAKYPCPFRESGCNQTFTERHNVKYHLNSHKSLTPYICADCSHGFATPGTLQRHKKRKRSCKGTTTHTIGDRACEPETS